MTLKPDYSWVPEGLAQFVGGVLAVCIIVSVVALLTGLLRMLFTRLTRARWDDVLGDQVLVNVLVGTLLLGSLSAGVGWGTGLFGEQGLDAGAEASALTGREYSKGQQMLDKLGRGDIFGAMGDGFVIIKDNAVKTAKGLGNWIGKIAKGDWKGAGKDVADTAKNAWDTVKGWATGAWNWAKNGVSNAWKWLSGSGTLLYKPPYRFGA